MKRKTIIKWTASFLLIGICSFTFLLAQKAKNQPEVLYLAGGRLINGSDNKVIENSLVAIEGNQIIYAGKDKTFKKTSKAKVIDCSGKTILPGLFDSHIHLGGACTFGYILLGEQRKLSGFLYCGVTSVFDLAAIEDWIFALRDKERNGEINSPRIFSVGPCFTCPQGHGVEYGVPMALTPATEQEAREEVQKLVQKKPDFIKIIYEKGSKRFPSLSYELMEAIIDEAHKNSFKVITHISTFEQAKDAAKAGTDGLAHVVVSGEVDSEFLQEMKTKNIFCIPTLSVYEVFSNPSQASQKSLAWPLTVKGVCQEILEDLREKSGLEMFSKSGFSSPELLSMAKANLKKMAEAGIKLALGTDAGNPAVFFGPSVHREMELMVEAGLSPLEAISAATKNAAEILGQADKLGSIERGKLADILIVEGNPLKNISDTQKIYMVIKNGEIIDREKLAKEINPTERPAASSLSLNETREIKDKEKIAKSSLQATPDQSLIQKIEEAKSKLQSGINTWNEELLKSARDIFLNLLIKGKEENAYLLYYVALCDYRIATYYFASNNMKEAEGYISEGQKYLEKAMAADPAFGESYALYATLLGYEIALHPDRAMTLGFKTYEYLAMAFEREPDNPRISLLKGESLLYTPEAYGGGAKNAIEFLEKAANLFERERVKDPLKPSWGKEEAYTFLGVAYRENKEIDKAKEFLKKALEVNPDFGLARRELEKIVKE